MLEVKNLVKIYSTKKGVDVHALDGVSVEFPETGMVFLVGKSGSGKSTLLNVAGGLDAPTSGEIIVNGKSSATFSPSDFDSYRNTYVGFIFQEYNILEEFTIAENIELALKLQNKPSDKKAVSELLEQVDLAGMGKRKPNTLSGGQRQRVAIARALIKNPKIIMADEPTGALDANTGKQIFDTLKKLSQDRLVIVVSHDNEFARTYADRIIELVDGKISSDKVLEKSEAVIENVRIINDNTITVKDWESVTEQEISQIVSVMKKRNRETVITADAGKIENVKNLLGIKEETTAKTVKAERGAKNTESAKFIKSRLPLGHAIKMAFGVMKTKPIRLAFTILLSVISFAIFGVFSSLMLYNPNYSIADALVHSNYDSIAIEKQYDAYFVTTFKTSDGEYEEEKVESKLRTAFTENDIERLNQNDEGLKFAGIIDFGSYPYGGAYENSKKFSFNDDMRIGENSNRLYYSIDYLCGFSDCGAVFISDNGFTLLAGSYPQVETEIALTKYAYEFYKNSVTTTYPSTSLGIETPEDMIGRSIKIGDFNFTVSGIYDVGDIPEKFDELRNKETELDKYALENLLAEFKDYIAYSFHTLGFVSADFYDIHKYDSVTIKERTIKGVSIDKEPRSEKISSENSIDVLTPNSVWQNTEMISFYNASGQKTAGFDLQKNQVLLPSIEIINLSLELKNAIVNNGLSSDPDCAEYIRLVNKYSGWQAGTKNNAEYETLFSLIFKIYPMVMGAEFSLPETYYAKNANDMNLTLEVVGFYVINSGKFSNSYRFYLSDEFCDEYSLPENDDNDYVESYQYITDYQVDWKNERYGYLITQTENTMSQSYFILESDLDGATFTMTNLLYRTTEAVASIVGGLKTGFLIASLVLGFFAMLMLFNFITVSIQAKTKEIGILRAVGARRLDVFKIFMAEALFITMLCFVLSTVISAVACGFINAYTLSSTVKMSLFDYGIINVLMSLGMALVVSSISTGIPVINTSKKSPVESIRAL